jgi:hypothetical protein
MSWELSLVFKATVLLGVALAAVGLSPRTRASRRHLILASAFAALIVLPVAGTLMPAVAIPLPITDLSGAAMGDAPSIAGVGTAPVSSRPSQSPPPGPAAPAPSLPTMLRALWLLGAASILTALAGSLWSLYRLQRSGMPWIAGQTMADAMARDSGVNRRVTVMVHERIAVPATWGSCARPFCCLPMHDTGLNPISGECSFTRSRARGPAGVTRRRAPLYGAPRHHGIGSAVDSAARDHDSTLAS